MLGLFTWQEAPTGRAVVAFVDPIYLLAHDVEGENLGSSHKLLSVMGLSRATDCRYVMSFTRHYSAKYVDSDSNPELGKKISVFDNMDKWRGVAARRGERNY